MSAPLAFPASRTPKGLKVAMTRPYAGPRSDETVSLMLTEAGIVDSTDLVEIDETYGCAIKVATRVYPIKATWGAILKGFKARHQAHA